ncbi:MAG: alkaline phosphatase family protein [Chloroflexota bacterium]
MKKYLVIFIGILFSLLIAVFCYFWATNLMDSLYAYRSPIADVSLPVSKPLGTRLTRRVVPILVDGLRVDTASNKEVMPFLNSLREQGASAVTHSGLPSYSAPGWSVLAIGAWPELSDGPAMNPTSVEEYRIWTQDNIFSSIHAAGLKTAAAANINYQYLIPPSALDGTAWTVEETPAADQQNITSAVQFIKTGNYDLVFTYMVQVDDAGHNEGGPRDPRWNEAARRADDLLREVVSTLDLTQDTVLIYSDHGQIDAGGHGGQDPVVLLQPFIMAGAGVKQGFYGDIHQVDIAPTITTLLGAGIPSAAQGRVLTEMLSLSPSQLDAVRQAEMSQQDSLYHAYGKAINIPNAEVSVPADKEPVSVYQTALNGLINTRLNNERLPRFLVLVPLMLIPPFLFFRKRSRKTAKILISIALYLLIFHALYAWLNGGTYTLSTVLSSNDLITTSAMYSGAAYLAAWVVSLFLLNYRNEPRSSAVEWHLGMTYSLVYVLALPAVWSLAVNGLLVSWTLPDVGSMFFGFIFILQILFVSVLNIPMAGITALISKRI